MLGGDGYPSGGGRGTLSVINDELLDLSTGPQKKASDGAED